MMTKTKSVLVGLLILSPLVLLSWAAFRDSAAVSASSGPEYTKDGQLKLPEHYREWVYLSSGFDMSYGPGSGTGHHMFDNVFVNPEAYSKFLETGSWPDKTMLVLEVRAAEGKGSINQNGNYQGTEVMGREVHVKDEARFPGKWAFFGFGDQKTAKMTPTSAACYSCHSAHGAVDTTFVQFYPMLLPIAASKGTLTSDYRKESSTTNHK